jgi:hypothetical protein|tara:strand:+ start:501 stop:644 length:144 start_codon:yes stop_codon:yes gene_type:complete
MGKNPEQALTTVEIELVSAEIYGHLSISYIDRVGVDPVSIKYERQDR